METEIKTETQVSLMQAADIIAACGERNTFHLLGEPGVGKTAMHQTVARALDLPPIYIDVPNTELGDIGVPMPQADGTTQLLPARHWGFHLNRPLCIMLDEFTKGSPSVRNMLHPLLTRPRRIGGISLAEGSVVITTGNLTTDGAGDSMPPHSRNRLSVLSVRKPTADEWMQWGAAQERPMHPAVLTFVRELPQCLASYRDPAQEGNHYIFTPKSNQKAFVSPRSLEAASNIAYALDGKPHEMCAALEGTIGSAGARDLIALVETATVIPPWDSIMRDPAGTPMPESPAALSIMAFSAMQRVTPQNVDKWFTYMRRAPKELQAMFCLSAAKNERCRGVMFTSEAFVKWARDNAYLF